MHFYELEILWKSVKYEIEIENNLWISIDIKCKADKKTLFFGIEGIDISETRNSIRYIDNKMRATSRSFLTDKEVLWNIIHSYFDHDFYLFFSFLFLQYNFCILINKVYKDRVKAT